MLLSRDNQLYLGGFGGAALAGCVYEMGGYGFSWWAYIPASLIAVLVVVRFFGSFDKLQLTRIGISVIGGFALAGLLQASSYGLAYWQLVVLASMAVWWLAELNKAAWTPQRIFGRLWGTGALFAFFFVLAYAATFRSLQWGIWQDYVGGWHVSPQLLAVAGALTFAVLFARWTWLTNLRLIGAMNRARRGR